MFMTSVTVTYIFFAPEGFGALTELLLGVGIGYEIALGIGLTATAVMTWIFYSWKNKLTVDSKISNPA